MPVRVLECPRCGAPLPRRAALVRVTCAYCDSEVTVDFISVRAREYRRSLESYTSMDDNTTLRIAGVPLRLSGRVGVGHSSDVFLGERATRLAERVVVKFLREASDESFLRNEQRVLAELEQSGARGSPLFSTLLPQRVSMGRCEETALDAELAAVFREPVGFAHTLADVREAFPQGLDARHLVWLWRRLLELLGWVHRSGWIHGALLPAHLLVDVRQHGARLVGWSCAGRPGEPLSAVDPNASSIYPEHLRAGGALSAKSDLAMLARCLLDVARGESHTLPSSVPDELARLLERQANEEGNDDAWALGEEVGRTARRCFGPPTFVHLVMPK